MRKRLVIISASLIILLMGSFQLFNSVQTQETFSKATIKYGSTGSDVLELQGRLKFLGYHYGSVDGIFGSKTLQSVKNFQYAFGMKVDGIAGSKTKLKLWEATKTWAPGANESAKSAGSASTITPSSNLGYSATDLKYLANAVYGESRGEPYEGQVAVAAVILNRIKSSSFPNTVYGVIFQPGAFTAVADGQIYLTPNEQAQKAVRDAINGWDPTGGCIYYFNPKTATSKWIWSRPQVKRIGEHIFCM